MLLPTTVVGSFPKPDYLKDARFKFVKKEISLQELENLTIKASEDAIDYQLKAGIDIISDGEMDRGDMATFFAERMEGFKISGLVRSYGNRYYKKPIVVGEVGFIEPMTVKMLEFAQERSQKPVKGIFTGPYTMMDWSFDEYYSDRKEMAIAMAKALHKEAVVLEKAGAKYIQIDEPAISTRPEEMDIAIESLGIVTKGLKAKTITHICYGDFDAIYPKMLKLPIDQIDLEFANRNFELLNTIKQHKFTKEVGLGVIDVHNHRIETVEQVKKGIKAALKVFKPEQIFVDPDCGLKTRMRDEAYQKLKVMVEATREVRKELE